MRGLLILLFLLPVLVGVSQSNPMFASSNDSIEVSTTEVQKETTSHKLTKAKSNSIKRAFNKFLRSNNKRQAYFRSQIVKYSNQLKTESKTKSYLWILLIAFLYGIAHSLGPGHNKILVFSYFIGEKSNVKQGLILGNLIAFIHALSGLVVSFIFIYIINKSVSLHYGDSNIDLYIQKFSFALISLIGVVLLISHIRNYLRKSNKESLVLGNKGLLTTALALGIIPCPGTMILVSFLSIAGLTYFAPIAALFMAFGMAFTISLIGIITILSRNVILRIFSNNSSLLNKVQFIIAILGSLLIILFGIVFLIG